MSTIKTLRRYFDVGKALLAIYFQVMAGCNYLPPTQPFMPVPAICQSKTGAGGQEDPFRNKKFVDTGAGFLRVKYETAHLLCMKVKAEMAIGVPWEHVAPSE